MAGHEKELTNKQEQAEAFKENAGHGEAHSLSEEIFGDKKAWADFAKREADGSSNAGKVGDVLGAKFSIVGGDSAARGGLLDSNPNLPREVDREAFGRNNDGSDGSGLLNRKDSVHDGLKKKEEERMTKDERKRYEDEQKQLDEYHKKMMSWSMGTIIPPPPVPERPDTPMHKELDRRVNEAEKKVRDEVYNNMSPSERAQFDRDAQRYAQEQRDAAPRNPFGTGDWRRPPQAPDSVKTYWERIRLAAERY